MGSIRPYRKTLITRVDTGLKPVNPEGVVSTGDLALRPALSQEGPPQFMESPSQQHTPLSPMTTRSSANHLSNHGSPNPDHTPRDHTDTQTYIPPSLTNPSLNAPMPSLQGIGRAPTPHRSPLATQIPHTTTEVETKQTDTLRRRRRGTKTRSTFSEVSHRQALDDTRTPMVDERFSARNINVSVGYGGFPGPFDLIRKAISHFLSVKTKQRLTRTLTLTQSRSLVQEKEVPYLDFDAIVGKNSAFHNLTDEQLEVLGGAEYLALRLLLRVVGVVSFPFRLQAWKEI
jgi:hypothetical protein